MTTMNDWIATACQALDLPADSVDTRLVLDLARDVAHGVDRPAAPVTAYLVGLAVGRGATPEQARDAVLAAIPPTA